MQEKQNFEENWRKAFDGAEHSPSDHVWTNIELDLAAEEGVAMKKRLVFFQRMAAGLVIVSLALGAMVWRNYQQPQPVASNQPVKGEPNLKKIAGSDMPLRTTADESTGSKQQIADASSAAKAIRKTHGFKRSIVSSRVDNQPASTAENIMSGLPASAGEEDQLVPTSAALQLPIGGETVPVEGENATPSVTSATQPTMTEEEALKLLQPFVDPTNEVDRKTDTHETLWLAMGASAGSYHPNGASTTQGNTDPLLLAGAANQAGLTTQHKLGNAYSMGVSVGKSISSRWVIQSGINYVNQNVDYSTNVLTYSSMNKAQMVVPEATSDIASANQSFSSVATTDIYTINSVVEMISIPLQAGYLLVDKKIGVQLNSGVSSDFFLRNVVVDESGRSDRVRQNAGKDSPYNSVNVTGLMSTEVSYQIGDNYRIALVPGLRYYFTSILKERTSTPMIMDIGFRFRYMMR